MTPQPLRLSTPRPLPPPSLFHNAALFLVVLHLNLMRRIVHRLPRLRATLMIHWLEREAFEENGRRFGETDSYATGYQPDQRLKQASVEEFDKLAWVPRRVLLVLIGATYATALGSLLYCSTLGASEMAGVYLLLHLPLDPIVNIRAGVAMVGLLMVVAYFVGDANEDIILHKKERARQRKAEMEARRAAAIAAVAQANKKESVVPVTVTSAVSESVSVVSSSVAAASTAASQAITSAMPAYGYVNESYTQASGYASGIFTSTAALISGEPEKPEKPIEAQRTEGEAQSEAGADDGGVGHDAQDAQGVEGVQGPAEGGKNGATTTTTTTASEGGVLTTAAN